MALDIEVEALAVAARAREGSRVRRALRRAQLAFQMRTVRAYRALFLDGAGGFTPDAVLVIADLGRVAKLGVADQAALPNEALRDRAAKRALALHLISRCDPSGAALSELARKIRELEHE